MSIPIIRGKYIIGGKRYDKDKFTVEQKNGQTILSGGEASYRTRQKVSNTRGKKYSYSTHKFTPTYLYFDSKGNLTKEVTKSYYSYNAGGGDRGGGIYDSKIRTHTDKGVTEVLNRADGNRILNYQTNFYNKSGGWTGRNWGNYNDVYKGRRQKEINKLNKDRTYKDQEFYKKFNKEQKNAYDQRHDENYFKDGKNYYYNPLTKTYSTQKIAGQTGINKLSAYSSKKQYLDRGLSPFGTEKNGRFVNLTAEEHKKRYTAQQEANKRVAGYNKKSGLYVPNSLSKPDYMKDKTTKDPYNLGDTSNFYLIKKEKGISVVPKDILQDQENSFNDLGIGQEPKVYRPEYYIGSGATISADRTGGKGYDKYDTMKVEGFNKIGKYGEGVGADVKYGFDKMETSTLNFLGIDKNKHGSYVSSALISAPLDIARGGFMALEGSYNLVRHPIKSTKQIASIRMNDVYLMGDTLRTSFGSDPIGTTAKGVGMVGTSYAIGGTVKNVYKKVPYRFTNKGQARMILERAQNTKPPKTEFIDYYGVKTQTFKVKADIVKSTQFYDDVLSNKFTYQYYDVKTPYHLTTVRSGANNNLKINSVTLNNGKTLTTTKYHLLGKDYYIRSSTTKAGTITKVFEGDDFLSSFKSTSKPSFSFGEKIDLFTKEGTKIKYDDFLSSSKTDLSFNRLVQTGKTGKYTPVGQRVNLLKSDIKVETITPHRYKELSKFVVSDKGTYPSQITLIEGNTQYNLVKGVVNKENAFFTSKDGIISSKTPTVSGTQQVYTMKSGGVIDWLDDTTQNTKISYPALDRAKETANALAKNLFPDDLTNTKTSLGSGTNTKTPVIAKLSGETKTSNIQVMDLSKVSTQKNTFMTIHDITIPKTIPKETYGFEVLAPITITQLDTKGATKTDQDIKISGGFKTDQDIAIGNLGSTKTGSDLKAGYIQDINLYGATKTAQIQKQTPKVAQETLTIPQLITQPPKKIFSPVIKIEPVIEQPPTKKLFTFGNLKDEKIKKRDTSLSGFDVFVKSKGKFLQVNKKGFSLGKSDALSLGAKLVDNSASATFVIRSSGNERTRGKGKNYFSKTRHQFKEGRGFGGLKFTEKNKYRINTGGEFKGITVKGILSNKSKKKKSKGGIKWV